GFGGRTVQTAHAHGAGPVHAVSVHPPGACLQRTGRVPVPSLHHLPHQGPASRSGRPGRAGHPTWLVTTMDTHLVTTQGEDLDGTVPGFSARTVERHQADPASLRTDRRQGPFAPQSTP